LDEKIFYKNLGLNLRHLRKAKGMTQEQFGSLFGLTKSAIVNYESGIRKIPIDLLYQIAMFHDVTIDSLICKKQTIADILKSEIGKLHLDQHEEDVLINFLHVFKGTKEGKENGKSINQKQK
jgi:transcriptional regulator with XRE-family HTH domain